MHPAPASTALALLALLATAGTSAAAWVPDMPDPAPIFGPAQSDGDEVQDAVLDLLYDSAATLVGATALAQERFDAFRAIAEDVVAELGATVNGCPVGSALPAVRVPESSAELQPDPATWAATLDAWGDDLAVPLNAEADCRAGQAPDVGAEPLDVPDLPSMPGLPDTPVPGVPGVPNIPDAEIPEAPALPLPS